MLDLVFHWILVYLDKPMKLVRKLATFSLVKKKTDIAQLETFYTVTITQTIVRSYGYHKFLLLVINDNDTCVYQNH